MSAWGAGRGLQVMVSNQGLQPQTQQGLLPALSPTQSATSGGWSLHGSRAQLPSKFPPSSPLPSPAHRPVLRTVPTC